MPYIPVEPVESSMITAVGYDEKSQTLRVVFHNGNVYDYPMFTPRDWAAFQSADSLGQHFHKFVKPNFGYRRVAESELVPTPVGAGISESTAKAVQAGQALGVRMAEQREAAVTGDGEENPQAVPAFLGGWWPLAFVAGAAAGYEGEVTVLSDEAPAASDEVEKAASDQADA